MPWTIANLVFHDKPARLGNMRSHGRKHVFVVCGNPDCPTTPNWTSAVFPTTSPSATYSHACSARSAIIAEPKSTVLAAPRLTGPGTSRTRSPSPMAERDQRLEMPATTSQACRRLSRISMWQTSARTGPWRPGFPVRGDVDREPDGRCRQPGLRDAFTHRGAACFEPKRRTNIN